jgi:hypothetical protein
MGAAMVTTRHVFNPEFRQRWAALRWSTKFIIVGVAIILIGLVPPVAVGLTIGTLESTASLFTIGILVLLIGMGIRRLQKAFG